MADTSPSPASSIMEPAAFEVEGHAALFGFPDTSLHVTMIRRSRGWRVGGAARTFGIAMLVAPVVALMPPHAIWPIGALMTGGVLARRRLHEHFTLVTLEGPCPKCASPFHIKRGRLKQPHPLQCEVCHHESTLKLPAEVLDPATPALP